MPLGDGWRAAADRPLPGGAPAPPPPPDAASGLTPGNGRGGQNFVPTRAMPRVICWPMPIRTSYRLLLPALLSDARVGAPTQARRLLADRRLERRATPWSSRRTPAQSPLVSDELSVRATEHSRGESPRVAGARARPFFAPFRSTC